MKLNQGKGKSQRILLLLVFKFFKCFYDPCHPLGQEVIYVILIPPLENWDVVFGKENIRANQESEKVKKS